MSADATKRAGSALEADMALQLRAWRLTDGMEREHRFAQGRRWRFDFAWPAQRVALEVEGGAWTGGRHTRGAGFLADLEKYNRAALDGWRVIRAGSAHVKYGIAASWIKEALAAAAATQASPEAQSRAVEAVCQP
jgi:very-short-patch-repair endonuclease